jgi:hypothetical protein
MTYLSPAAHQALNRLTDLHLAVTDELVASRIAVAQIANEIAHIRRRDGRSDGPGFGKTAPKRVWWRR